MQGYDSNSSSPFFRKYFTYNQRDSLFLLDGTEDDIGVDHDAIEVTVVPGDTLHGAGTGDEWLGGGEAS